MFILFRVRTSDFVRRGLRANAERHHFVFADIYLYPHLCLVTWRKMVELVEMFGVREEVYNVGAEVVAGAWCYGEGK